jgi:hypothetical protein
MPQVETALDRAEGVVRLLEAQLPGKGLPSGAAFELLVSELAQLLYSPADDAGLAICAHRERRYTDSGSIRISEDRDGRETLLILIEDGRIVSVGRDAPAGDWRRYSAAVVPRK